MKLSSWCGFPWNPAFVGSIYFLKISAFLCFVRGAYLYIQLGGTYHIFLWSGNIFCLCFALTCICHPYKSLQWQGTTISGVHLGNLEFILPARWTKIYVATQKKTWHLLKTIKVWTEMLPTFKEMSNTSSPAPHCRDWRLVHASFWRYHTEVPSTYFYHIALRLVLFKSKPYWINQSSACGL